MSHEPSGVGVDVSTAAAPTEALEAARRRLAHVLAERSALGVADSALLVAVARVLHAYVRRELAREAGAVEGDDA